jgi:octaprenyl-diphosphate synthase
MLANKLKAPVSSDMEKVDKLILDSLCDELSLVRDIGMHLIKSGGKRLRPILVLLSARACGYLGSKHVQLATVIEFIHTATLLHDDVVDGARLRRGSATANELWDNKAAILVGDFLYSRAFQLMVQVSKPKVMEIIANTTNIMANGEVMQLMHQKDAATNEMRYLHMIRCKTAKLFEAAAQIGAVIADSEQHIETAIAQFGLHLGTAYQLIDDLLDYNAKEAEFGKVIGKDCAEGKITMPLIYLLKHGTATQKQLIDNAIKDNIYDFPAIQQALDISGALQYTQNFAKREISLAKQALSELPHSEFKEAILQLADYLIARNC